MKVVLYGRGRTEEPEWAVLLLVAIALLLGWLVQTSVISRVDTATVGNVSVSYPASWGKATEDGAAFAATDVINGGPFAPRLSVRQVAKTDLLGKLGNPTQASLTGLASTWSIKRGAGLIGYRVLKIEATKLQGRDAANVSYAYLGEPRQAAATRVLPRVMQAVDTLVVSGDQIYILTFASDSAEFSGLDDMHQRLVAAWRVP